MVTEMIHSPTTMTNNATLVKWRIEFAIRFSINKYAQKLNRKVQEETSTSIKEKDRVAIIAKRSEG